MMLCSEVAMTDAEKESEARCKAMLNELISVVKKQTMEMEDLAERMDELAVGLKAIVKPLGAPVQALPPRVPAPTATLVAAVVHAVAAATPCAEAAHAPESPTKCSTSGPDPNAGYAKVAVVSLLSRGATTARRALAEPMNVSSSKSFNTGELDTVTPTRCSTACRGCNTNVPPTCPQKVAPTPPSADTMLDAAVIALVHSTGEIAVDKDGNTDTLEHAAMGQVEAALASDGHDNLWINYNIRFPDFSSCVFAALVVPAMEVFGEMGDKNKREQYFVDMVWEQWLEPWPPPHRHGNLLELFHKQAGIRSWRTTFANAEMGVLNLLVHGVILVEQLLLPYWDYGKFQSLFWVQLKSYSNTHCHGCVELMVGLVSAEQGVEAMGPFQLVISSGIGFDVVSLSEFFIVYAEVKGYFQGLQVHLSNPNYEMESKEQKPTHRRNESVDLTSSKIPAETIEAKMVSERPADDENEVVENGIINGRLKSFSMSDKEQGVANAGGNARLIGRSETGERGISSRCRPSTSSDENSCSSISSISKPHKANDSRWEVIQMIRTRDGILGPSHFKLLKKLGCGDIGSMYLLELSGTKSYFAMKVMDKASLASRKKFLRAQTEKEILQCLDHPFLPTLYTHLETDRFSCLVMEFCLGEDLHTLRQRKHGKYFPEQAVKSYVAEILLALEYLHMLGIIYRDLKPENILVCEDGHITLSDFDLSLRCVVSPTLIRSSNPDTKVLRKNSQAYCVQPACVEPSCMMWPSCAAPTTCFGPRLFSKSKKDRKPKPEVVNQVSPWPELIAEPSDARSISFVGTHENLAPEIIKGLGNRATLFNVIGQPLHFPEYLVVSFSARDLIRCLLVKEPQQRLVGNGDDSFASAWGQAAFQEGRNITDLPDGLSWIWLRSWATAHKA